MNEPLFPFRPNWRRPLVERLEWLTDVMESKNGTEDRTQLRAIPRRTIEYEFLLQGQALARLDALVWGSQAKLFAVPVWSDPQALSAPLASGSDEIPAQTAGFDFSEGGLAVLWRDDESLELVRVASVASDSILLATPTVDAWPAGTLVYPARIARMEPEIGMARSSAAVGQGVVRFEMDSAVVPAQPSASTYRGMEVNLRRPNWAQGIESSYRRKTARLDYDVGAVFVDDLSGMPTTMRTHRYLLQDRAAIAEYRGWLHARAGRLNGFWQPQWQIDLAQAAPIFAGATTMRVRALGHAANYAQQDGRRDIAIRHRATGAWYFRRVLDTELDETQEVLTLDASLGIAGAPGDFVITWLMPSRLEADAIEIAWHSAGVAASAIDIRSTRA